MKITEFDEQVKDDQKWSSLPTLLVWMIRARLDYPNSVRFALVCKHWQHASASYPLHFKDENEVDNSPPWIMYHERFIDSKREFISLVTKEHYTIDNPDFSACYPMYSRQGWILFFRMKLDGSGECFESLDSRERKYESPPPYVLLNPFKNLNIKLPLIGVPKDAIAGAFTIHDGNPHCIVLSDNEFEVSFKVVVYITYPGDKVWRRYSYTTGELDITNVFLINMFIIGNVIYLATMKARVFVFDITDLQWKDLMLESSELTNLTIRDEQYFMLTQGQILRLRYPRGDNIDFRKAKCYRLNIGENVRWELIDDCVLARTSFCFLNRTSGHSFVSRIDEVNDLVKLGKGFRERYLNKLRRKNTFALRRVSNFMLVHMS